jgi:hypothetical protein
MKANGHLRHVDIRCDRSESRSSSGPPAAHGPLAGPAAGCAKMRMRRREASAARPRPVVPVGPTADGANLRDRQASFYRCQRSNVGVVLKLLFTLFEYYADYFSYYADYFKNTNGVSGEYSLWKSVSMISGGDAEAATHHS